MFFARCAIAVFALFLSASAAGAEDLPGHFVPANPVFAMPEISFTDSQGHNLHLSDFKGRPVLLNLWATWCGPCVQEMPSLDKLQSLLGDKKLVVIALDEERNGADMTMDFFKRHGVKNLGVYSDPSGHIASTLHARGLPTSFLVDANGMLNGFVVGGTDWSTPEMIELLRGRLATPTASPEY